jgi:hypothetical protein
MSIRDKLYNRDEHCKDSDLHEKSLGDEDGKEDNMAPPEVHQHGGDSTVPNYVKSES